MTSPAARLATIALATIGFIGTAMADVSGGYQSHASTQYDYLTVTQVDHKLTGYIQAVALDLNAASGFIAQRISFEGEISGSTFTIHLSIPNSILGEGLTDCSGKADGAVLQLFIPLANGQTNT